jgi:hypothetical protein
MPTTTEHVARKPRTCGNYRCESRISPGDRYRRHVAFPGDEGHEEGTRPWVLDECWPCVTNSEAGAFDYIRDRYRVPAARDVRVIANGQPGVIVGVATGPRLFIRLDGDRRACAWHPTWRIKYLTAA